MLTSPSIWSLDFWKAAAERAITTAAQAVALQIADESIAVNAFTLNWPEMGGFALGGAFLSVLKSIIVNAKTKTGPSLTESETVAKPLPPVDEL